MSFEVVAGRAIEYARDGFALRPRTAATIERQREFIEKWPTNRKTWLKPDGSVYAPGETIKLPELAATLTKMVQSERRAKGRGRRAALAAARDRFYKGDIAREMVRFLREHETPFEEADFAEFFARVEEPASITYRGFTVYKQGFNSQGPSLLQTLNILENFDLQKMGHNSADYLHVLTEAMKMAYADRDSYYADPQALEGIRQAACRADRHDARGRGAGGRRSAAVRRSSEGMAVLGGRPRSGAAFDTPSS
jgi:gamma-glutamyltranspeptidase/glutathione hydrolase